MTTLIILSIIYFAGVLFIAGFTMGYLIGDNFQIDTIEDLLAVVFTILCSVLSIVLLIIELAQDKYEPLSGFVDLLLKPFPKRLLEKRLFKSNETY